MSKGILHLFRLTGFTLLLSVLLALLYLMMIGVPEPLIRKITDAFQKKGIPIRIESINLSARHGWVLHNVRVHSPDPDDLRPLLQTDNLYLFIWPKDWTALSQTEWTLRLSSKQMGVSLGLPWETALDEAHPFRTIDRFQARLRVDPTRLVVDSAKMNWGGLILTANGQVAFSKQTQPPRPAFFSTIQTYAPQVAAALANLMFDAPPQICLQFDIPADAPEKIQAEASLVAAGLQRQDQRYEQITGKAHLLDNELQLDSLQIIGPDNGQLTLSGRYNLSCGTAQLEVSNTLPLLSLLGLLPKNAAAGVIHSELQPLGTSEFTAVCGPAPPKQLFEQLRVQIHSFPLTYKGLALNPLRGDLVRNGSRMEIKKLQMQADGNPLAGNMEMDLDSGAWRFSAEGRVPTAPLGELLGGTAQGWVDRFKFSNRLADITVDVSSGGKKGTFTMRSTVSGQDLFFAGVPFDSVDVTMTYSNRTFALTPLQASQGDHSFSGTIELDLDRRRAAFTADSSFPPDTIARIIAPDHPTILTNFTFAGSLTSSASGSIDYSGEADHDIQGSIRTTSVSAGGWTADSFSGQIEARGDRLIFTNSTMSIWGGSISGSAVFDLQFNESAAPYRLDIAANDLDVAAIIQRLSTENGNKAAATGRLAVTLDVAADAKAGFWASANGRGTAEIKNGQLRDLPVLGGFSNLIRTTLPGFSLFSLTTFYSDYALRDGAFYSDNTQVGGTLFSARARGKYSPDQGLDFTVRAEPLRQIRENKEWYQFQLWAADAIKMGTAPLFDLLEFKLEGSLTNPRWQMKALPKETYQLFENLPTSSPEK